MLRIFADICSPTWEVSQKMLPATLCDPCTGYAESWLAWSQLQRFHGQPHGAFGADEHLAGVEKGLPFLSNKTVGGKQLIQLRKRIETAYISMNLSKNKSMIWFEVKRKVHILCGYRFIESSHVHPMLVHGWIGWIPQQAGRMPSRGTELCAVVEAMWSLVLVAQGATKDDDAVQLGHALQSLHRSNKLHYHKALWNGLPFFDPSW